ncbi:ATP-binding protein [Streptomyces sp. NPDC004457]
MASKKGVEGQIALGDDVAQVGVADFVEASDSAADEVSVKISLTIIQRFSEGLYSSPNKAFEELVSNSYDAGAGRVWVYMPSDLEPSDSSLVIIDDGESMDLDGLQQLWEIGTSRKRVNGHVKGRPPIGKFGIGKLATYVLAEELTYITCRDGEYRAITMDYRRVQGKMSDPHGLRLLVARLTADEAKRSLASALEKVYMGTRPRVLSSLFADSERPSNRTAAVMTSLKPRARHIRQGRLRWVLSTALPLNPAFQLWLNDGPIEPSKASGKTYWTYTMTSPPYLVAIDYLRGHRMSLVWMGYDIDYLRELRGTNIGSSRGGSAESEVQRIQETATSGILGPSDVRLVNRYIGDMWQVISEIARVLRSNGGATFVIADARLKGASISVEKIIVELCGLEGLSLSSRACREIPANRRYLPPPRSSGKGLNLRMREEVILGFVN